MNTNRRVIYDLGSNNGDDIPYYLEKADLVVAVEANPQLCEFIRRRFVSEIALGRLVIENRVVSATESETQVPFFIHNRYHVLSQLPKPGPSEVGMFTEVMLTSVTVPALIEKWGSPHYVKIDLEHYDAQALRSMFGAGIYPDYVSAESHSIEVFCLLVAQGNYNAFKLVDGATVQKKFHEHDIETIGGKRRYSFPHHSAGPFGNDIPGPWFSADNFVRVLAVAGLGWKDIHATNRHAPDLGARLNISFSPRSGVRS